MRIIVEEIVKAHPSGANAGGYLRVQRFGCKIDEAAATLLVDNESTELWIAQGHDARDRRSVQILTHRVVAGADGMQLIVDVATQEVCDEIVKVYERGDYEGGKVYIAWAKKHEVWP